MIKKLLFTFGIISLCVANVLAQSTTTSSRIELSEKDKVEFKLRVGQMIDRLQENLSLLGSKEYKNNVKKVYEKETLRLFMGEGEAYEESNGIIHDPVKMQVSSVRYGITTIRNIYLKKYLKNLIRIRYAKVELTQAKTFYVGNIQKVGDHYEAVATIFQKFCGYNDGVKKYCDVTTKNIHIYIIPQEDEYGQFWLVKFGDIDVKDTTGI